MDKFNNKNINVVDHSSSTNGMIFNTKQIYNITRHNNTTQYNTTQKRKNTAKYNKIQWNTTIYNVIQQYTM